MRMFLFAALAGAASLLAAGSPGPARADGIAVSEPVAHGNLAIYFIHGPSAPGPVPLTLQEAMVKETVRVIETGSVNELKIENIGGEDVFIQSGDIVKGGRQDRVLTVSFILPRKSGEVPVASYCVEHGRWSGRGNESSTRFASSYNALPSREAKLAMKAPPPAAVPSSAYGNDDTGERQRKVWEEVAKTQGKLSAGVHAPVAAPASASSLELSLENKKLEEARAEYAKALQDKAGADDIVGFAFAVNGRINSADVYPSNGLFRKMWAKQLNAAITEAVGEKNQAAAAAPPPAETVRAFLEAAEKGKADAQKIGALAEQETRDADTALFVQSARAGGAWVHKNYLAK